MPKLVVKQGPFPGKEFEFGQKVVIGRGSAADVFIPDATMSRQHARIESSGNQFLICDLGSGNGTKVNGAPVSHPTALKHGDSLQFGNVVIQFVLPRQKAAPASQDVETVLTGQGIGFPSPRAPAPAGAAPPPATDESVVVLSDEKGPGREVLQEMDASNPVASILAQGDSLKAMLDMSRRLQLVYEVGEAISTTLNEQKLVSVIMDKLLEVFPQAERGFIMFYSPEKNQLTARVARTRTGKATEITVSRHLIREVIAKRKGILSADAMGDDRFRAEVSVYQYGIRSVICVPMLAKGEVIGIIHVDASDPTRSFVKDDMALLLGIAGQAALAISNVRLHQRLVHQELIEQDLALAHRIQQRFLPRSPPLLEGYHFHASYSAAQEVGGDYYDFIELPDRHYGIVIGDVSGKGVSAALYMARLSSDVRYHAAGHTEPAEILERLSHVMRSESEENMLVTMLFLSLNVATAELKISNAGHHPPVVRRANGEVFSRHGALNPPLGFEASEAFEQEAMQLEPGDSIVLFTDGVTEAMNAKHEMYDMERLLQVIRGSAGEPAELAGSIARSVKSFIRDAPQSDDITLVCFGRKQEPG